MDSLREAKTKLAAVNKDTIAFISSFTDDKSFVETDAFVGSETDTASALGEGVVSGFATVDGRGVCVFALNSAVMKGSIGSLGAKKIVRTVNNAVRMNKPLIAVWDTSGARFAEGIECLEGYGDILRAFTIAYGDIPVISVIKGKNYGLSAYAAGISDFVIAFKDSVSATASPLVLAAKSGADKTGTAEELFARGTVTNLIKKEELKKTICNALDAFGAGKPSGDDVNRTCKGLKPGVSVDTVIKEVFDKNSFLPIRGGFSPCAVTGFATLADVPVGVVATDATKDGGRLTADGCVKISEFLNACDNANCPVVFLTDCVGTEQGADDARLIRDMSDLIYRVNMLSVNTFSVVYGKAIGGAYTATVAPCSYKIAWDSAEIAAVDSENAARLLYADEIKTAKNKDKAAQKLAESYAAENCSALKLAREGYFDNVIEPNLTRVYLIAALLAHVEQ